MRGNKQLFGKLFHPAKIQTYKRLLKQLFTVLILSLIILISSFTVFAIVTTIIGKSIEAYTGKSLDQLTVELDPDLSYGKKMEDEARLLHSRFNK